MIQDMNREAAKHAKFFGVFSPALAAGASVALFPEGHRDGARLRG